MNRPLHSAVQREFQTFFKGLNISDLLNRVYAIDETSIVTTPALFITAKKGQEIFPQAGIYKVPVEIRLVYMAQDIKENPTALDLLTGAVETALTGSKDGINNASSDLFVMYLSEPESSYLDVVEDSYQHVLTLDTVCKIR